jgi:PspAA-like protein
MIARLMGEGQYRIDDALHEELNRLDERAMAALEANDEAELDARLDEIWQLVKERGERLADDDLSPSDLIVPPSDLSLEESRALFAEDGLIPDLPT